MGNTKIVTFTTTILLANLVNCSTLKEKLSPKLWARVEDFPDEATDVIVVLRPPPESKSSESNTTIISDFPRADPIPLTDEQIKKCALIKAIYKALVDIHDASAAEVIAALVQLGARFICFWINNTCFVYGATVKILKVLTEISTVEKIIQDIIFKRPDNPDGNRPVNDCTGEVMEEIQWSVQRMKADRMWDLGITGRGITVAVLDTGVFWEHDAIKDNMRPTLNWFDPYNGTLTPNDSDAKESHGTAVTGCAVGRNGIGVAKDAQWIACKALYGGYGSAATVTECLQWALCPTSPDKKTMDCCMAPDIINMSFGDNKTEAPADMEVMEPALQNLRKAGIILVASIGNDGSKPPYCGTAGYPGFSPSVLSVGATNATDFFAWFTSVGPGLNDADIQPYVCAPGENITTAAFRNNSNTDPKCYLPISGTSFSTPYTAGAIALLLSWDYNLSQDDIKEMFKNGAVKLTTFDAHLYELPKCKDDVLFNTHQFPNNIYGYGFVDIFNIYSKA